MKSALKNLLFFTFTLLMFRCSEVKKSDEPVNEEFIAFETNDVTRVSILDNTNSVELTKGDKWIVSVDGRKKLAVTNHVTTFLSTLQTIEPSEIASRNQEDWSEFGVDSTALRISVFEGSDKTLDLYIGYFGVEGEKLFYTYVRKADESTTYIVEDFMRMSLSSRTEDFRNNQILRFSKDSLVRISFDYPDSSFTLSKRDEKWQTGSVEMNQSSVNDYVSSINFLTSKSFVEQAIGRQPELKVTYVFSGSEEIQVSAIRRSNSWVIESSINEEESWMDTGVFEKVFVSKASFE